MRMLWGKYMTVRMIVAMVMGMFVVMVMIVRVRMALAAAAYTTHYSTSSSLIRI